jgi:predicted acylesterase/phospholipase RssA/CRP-like cAMP-binding protein
MTDTPDTVSRGRAGGRTETRIIAALRRSPLFVHASLRHLGDLVRDAEPLALAPGEVLYEQGGAADAFYVLVEGALQTWASGTREGTRTRVLLREVHPVACLGEADVVLGHERPFTAAALRPSRVLRVDGRRFDALLRRSTLFRHAIRRLEFEQERVHGLTDEHERTSAEVVALLARDPGVPLRPLTELLAGTLAAEYGDRALVVRVRPDAHAAGPSTPKDGPVPVLEVSGDADRLFASRAWNERLRDHDFVLLDLTGCSEETARRFRPWLDRALAVFRPGGDAWAGLSETCRVQPVVLMPPGGWGDVRPALPVAAIRVRLDLDDVRRSGGDRARVRPATREALARFARGVSDRTVGVALGGGGAWGYAHVALLEALADRGVPVDVVSGSSFGAVCGAFYCARGREGLRALVAAGRPLRTAALRSIVDSGAIERFIAKEVPGWLEDLDTTFLPVVTDVASGRLDVFRGTTIARAVRASGSFPFALTATVQRQADGVRRFVDGGIASNVPDSVLLDEGADFVIAANVVPPPHVRPAPRPTLPGAIGLWLNEFNPVWRIQDAVRSAFILLHAAGVADAGLADVLYDTGPLDFLPYEFDKARAILDRVGSSVAEAADLAASRWRARRRPEPAAP